MKGYDTGTLSGLMGARCQWLHRSSNSRLFVARSLCVRMMISEPRRMLGVSRGAAALSSYSSLFSRPTGTGRCRRLLRTRALCQVSLVSSVCSLPLHRAVRRHTNLAGFSGRGRIVKSVNLT